MQIVGCMSALQGWFTLHSMCRESGLQVRVVYTIQGVLMYTYIPTY